MSFTEFFGGLFVMLSEKTLSSNSFVGTRKVCSQYSKYLDSKYTH